MANRSTYILAVLLLAMGTVKFFKTAAQASVNVTIDRAPLYDSFSFGSSSKLIQSCELKFDSRCRCNRTNSGFFEGNWSCVNMERLGNIEGNLLNLLCLFLRKYPLYKSLKYHRSFLAVFVVK